MKETKMTPKKKAFADYYIELGNAEQAAIKAGYSKAYSRGNAHKLVADSCISSYIEVRIKEMDSKRIASAEEVLQFLTRVMRGEEKDAFGLDTSNQDKIKAGELLGKRYRLFTEKLEAEVNVNSTGDKKKIEDVLSKIKGVKR